jgi:NAD(P)-dependent dehydrogenase (short-subunit alcohol dehydrogenase family)
VKTVLVTGASSGLGRSCVERFFSAQWNVVAALRSPQQDRFSQAGDRLLQVQMDVVDQKVVARAVAAGIDRFGSIDVVVNCAGYGLKGPFEGLSHSHIQHQFEVNLFGVMHVCRAVLPQMRARREGTIINVSSAAGVFGIPLASIYAASKFALEGFSESLSYELLAQNIVVKIVEPGGMEGTSFVANSARASSSSAKIEDYSDFVRRAELVYRIMNQRRSAPVAHVADVVFRAATDGTDQLRYVATEDIAEIVRQRRETSEAEFMAKMRERFPNRKL